MELNEGNKSKEHIFPEAIGGCIVIFDAVCKNCNERLGSFVDSHLTNHWYVQLYRLLYKIPGKDGVIPNPFGIGALASDKTQRINYKFSPDGIPLGVFLEINKLESTINGTKIFKYTLDNSKGEELLNILTKKVKRLREQYKDKIKFESLEFFKGNIENPSIIYKKKLSDYKWQICILKIAYELTFKFLGEKYLSNPTAKKFRNLLSLEEISKKDLMKSEIKRAMSYTINSESLPFIDNAEYLHAGHFFINSRLYCFIRIFNIFQCSVVVAENIKGDYLFDSKIYQTNVKNKTYHEWVYSDYIANYFK